MTKEKIVAFLNMDLTKPLEKGYMKMGFWFDFCVTIFVIGAGSLMKVFRKTMSEQVFIGAAIASVILFAVWLTLAKNPAQDHSYCFFVALVSSIKLTIGSICFSRLENEVFSIWHVVVAAFFIVLALVIVIRKQYALKYLETHSIEEAQDMIIEKTKGVGIIILPISATASIALGLSRVLSRTFDVGFGFLMWALGSIWWFMAISFGYSYIISIRYKVAQIFKKQMQNRSQNTEAGSSS